MNSWRRCHEPHLTQCPRPLMNLVGPVGISDAIGHTNMTLARATADAGGRLLQPSQPIAALDINFAVNPQLRPAGHVWSTMTKLQNPSSAHVYILALFMSAVRHTSANKDGAW